MKLFYNEKQSLLNKDEEFPIWDTYTAEDIKKMSKKNEETWGIEPVVKNGQSNTSIFHTFNFEYIFMNFII